MERGESGGSAGRNRARTRGDEPSASVLYVGTDGDDVPAALKRGRPGLSVTTASGPEAALSRIESGDVDCVVSDGEAGENDGAGVLDAVRRSNPDLPVIVYTAAPSEEAVGEALAAGATDVVRRPPDPGEHALLAHRIDAALATDGDAAAVEETLRERERYIQELYEITSNPETTFDEKVRGLLEMGCERLDLDFGFLIETNEDEGEFEVHEMHGTHDGFRPGLTAPLSQTYCKHVIGSDGVFVLQDAAAEGYADDPASESGIVCYLGSEVTVGDEVFGTFCFANTSPREAPFTDAEVTYVELMSEWVSYGLERRRAKAELAETVDRLEQSNAELERFAYVASHDLQEPLRMVTSYLNLLERRYGDALDDDAEEFIEYAVGGAERMRSMIQGLLEFSRLDTQGGEFEPTDCERVVDEATTNLRITIAESDAEVAVEPLPTVVADETQLVQLFQNLVGNAVEHGSARPGADDGPAEGDDGSDGRGSDGGPRIRVSAERGDGEWVFSVSDDGVGIDPADADHVFEMFNDLDGADESGTGIGLAICRKIVERHGGRIWVDADAAEGATFRFTIPDREATGDSA
ncbi:response regulator [Halostella sp. JP-L12]|uniref:sensor histidine kinase n=1 Tax=Halostella TaxID=1843185 RepID=UPI000EF84D5A|nr:MULTISPECIES: ATP-binding protein [Halostella]NHN47515.1 response regulator [Halostella sp. JP-L12]